MAEARKFEEKLLDPSPDWLEAQSQIFDFELSEVGNEPISICGLRKRLNDLLGRTWVEVNFGLPVPEPEAELLPILKERDRFTHVMRPRSLDHLKQLVGVPNAAILRARKIDPLAGQPRRTRTHLIPGGRRFAFRELQPEQRQAVHDAATNLVYGFADPGAVKGELAGVADYALEQAGDLPVFAAKDLIVCDGESVHFNGWGTLFFHNVVIEGTGEIQLGGYTKLHAYHVERV